MNTTEEGNPIQIKRPTVVTIAAIIVVVLALFVTGLGFAGQFGLTGRGFGNRQFVPGQFSNRNFTPQNGFPSTGNNNGQTNQGINPNFTGAPRIGTGFSAIFRLFRPVMIGLDILLLILAGVAAFGLFKSRRWGATLAIVISVLLVLLTIPGMLRIFSALSLVENLVRILLAVAVIVLLLLPVARNSYLPVHDDSDLLMS